MEDLLRSCGLEHKKTILGDHIVEAVNNYGNSVIVWSGTEVGTSAVHDEASAVRAHMNKLHEHAKNVCGLYVHHPEEGSLIKHGKRELCLGASEKNNQGSVLRVLPVITTEELQHNHKAAIVEADKVFTRISNSRVIDVVAAANEYNEAHLQLQASCQRIFEDHDLALHALIERGRKVRENIEAKASKEQVAIVQDGEKSLDILHSHAVEIRGYSSYLNELAVRLESLRGEIVVER